jgi:hypothetical protein
MEKSEKKWKPKIGAKYYQISSGHILKGVHKRIWEGSKLDEAYYKEGNCFRSRKEAEFIYKSFNGAF